jgi:hypothetical protein
MAISVRNPGVPLFLFIVIQSCLFLLGALTFINYLNLIALFGILVFLFLDTKLKGRFHKRIFAGLLATLIGFIYFSVQDDRYLDLFPSMLFFLLPQLFFISAFYLDFRSAPELDKRGARIAIALAFLISLGYYLTIRAHLGILKLPVMIGVFTSSLMFMMASFRNLRVNSRSFWTIVVGVLLYMLAEGLFAYHSFAQPIAGIVMIYSITLLTGLYLILLGTISRRLLHVEAST